MVVCEVFETAVFQAVGTSNLAKDVANVLVSDQAILAPTGTFMVKLAGMTVSRASKHDIHEALSFVSPSIPDK